VFFQTQTQKPNNSNLRVVYNRVFDVNITSVAAVGSAFIPLLKRSEDARVINVSSSRGSVTLQMTGQLPPTAAISYLISKTVMNVLTLELRKLETDVLFHFACPGHCKTGLNGYRAAKDPVDGAKVIVELAASERETYKSGFWQFERDEMREVPW
jgi:NAD(P)-dependent dehydrogenase (short-subunit alcohol dehydrogenase family)